MAKGNKNTQEASKRPPGRTPEARENELINLAVDLAEEQLRSGKASSQVITHYLKRSSIKEQVELEILKAQKELVVAKTQAIQSAERIEELYKEAMAAMRTYDGTGRSDEDENL